MQILKSAEDEAIYNRAKAGHDGTMDAYIQWFENGPKPKKERLTPEEKRKYEQAREKVGALREKFTATEIGKAIGIHSGTIYHVQKGTYRHVGIGNIETILEFDGTVKTDRPIVSQEEHEQAAEIVKELYSELGNMPKVSRELDLSVTCLWKFQKDQHRIPSPSAHQIINYNSTN